MTKPDNRWFIIGFILIITFSSFIGINQYYYGMWNQFIALPWLYDLIDPSLYPHDPVIAQRENSPSFYNYMLKGLTPVFGGDIGLMHFVIFVIVHLLTFISFFKLSLQFFDDKRSAFFAIIVLCGSFPTTGYVATIDSVLMERTIALPLLIFSLVFLLRQKWLIAIFLQALAFNVHPLSSAYLIGFSWLGVVFAEGLKWRYLKFWPLLLLFMLPVLYLRWLHSSGEGSFGVSAEWMEIMYIRNYHHAFPWLFEPVRIAKAALIVITFFILVYKSGFDRKLRKWLYGFGTGVLVFVLIGTIFTEIYPVRLIIQLQAFRSVKFLIMLTLILWTGLVLNKDQKIFLILGIPVLMQYYYGILSKSIGMTILVVAGYFILKRNKEFRAKPVAVLTLLVVALGFSAWYVRGSQHLYKRFSIQMEYQKDEWYELQEWFKEYSAQDALAIVPPSETGFRLKSLRTCYGEWHDGTKAFFNEEYALLWWDRMQSLNCTDPDNLNSQYRANSKKDFEKIWQGELRSKHSEAYVVTYADMNLDGMELAFENEDYKVFRL